MADPLSVEIGIKVKKRCLCPSFSSSHSRPYSNIRESFSDDLSDWIDFVCDCRDEKPVFEQYDLNIGKVANDKVFRVVDMYHSGIWDRERALQEIKVYPNYDQIAFISQAAVDKLLTYDQSWEI